MSADLLAAFGLEDTHTSPAPARTSGDGKNRKCLPLEKESSKSRLRNQPHELKVTEVLPSNHAGKQNHNDSNVLFDADTYESERKVADDGGDDDFGDFAHVDDGDPSHSKTTKKVYTGSLIDLREDEISSVPQNNSKSHDGNLPPAILDPIGQVVLMGSYTNATHLDDHNNNDEEDEWGQFEDVEAEESVSTPKYRRADATNTSQPIHLHPPTIASQQQQGAISVNQISENVERTQEDVFDDKWDSFDEEDLDSSFQHPIDAERIGRNPVQLPGKSPEIRPTNIPPPAMLLDLFSTIFSVLSAQDKKDSPTKAGIQALQAFRTCARVIAGRPNRWKRDTNLAQSMRIGAAGRSNGMKLTTLDKGEIRREDQAAQEAISSWSRSSHKLNAAIVKAKVVKPPVSLSTKLSLRVATGPDILISNHICPVCGLRRNERIGGVDVDANDIFGEFWIEHWGHTDCHDTWCTYSNLLDQR